MELEALILNKRIMVGFEIVFQALQSFEGAAETGIRNRVPDPPFPTSVKKKCLSDSSPHTCPQSSAQSASEKQTTKILVSNLVNHKNGS